jgi:uncharacterized protein
MAQPTPTPPLGEPTSDDRTWAAFSHWGAIILGFIAPLVIMLTKGKESGFVREQSVESLNFQITVLIGVVASVILIFVIIGIFTLIAIAVAALVFEIMAGIAANNGRAYRYPFALRLVK